MAKGYWVVAYHAVNDEEKLGAYLELASPTVQAAGGRFLARGLPTQVHEAGVLDRTVLVEFPSVEVAVECHDSEGYQAALAALGDGATRDLRIIEGVE
ncbi:MAG: DUF1330 domain-containing protein [Actinomycetota bacterium]